MLYSNKKRPAFAEDSLCGREGRSRGYVAPARGGGRKGGKIMSAKPFLSICIPAYNRSGRLKANLSSLLSACGDELEAVVVDNVSSENLEEVCKGFNDPRISYYRNETPIVAQANWMRSVRLAKGQWALLMMDRDFINGRGIPALMEALEKNRSFGAGNTGSLVDGKEKIYSQNPRISRIEEFPAGEIRTLLEVNRVSHPSGDLYNREFLTLSESDENAIMQNPRSKENVYFMCGPAWEHGFLRIQTDMIYRPSDKYLKTYKSGFKASHAANRYGVHTLEGLMKYMREDLEELLKFNLSEEEKKALCAQAYNGYVRESFTKMISTPRTSGSWAHYDEEYKYRSWRELNSAAAEFCEMYRKTVRLLLGDGAEDALAEIKPIRIDWQTYLRPAVSAIPIVGPAAAEVKHRLNKIVRKAHNIFG